jgi:hypothetical protein
MSGSLQLRDYPGDIVRLSCAKCGRSGLYRKQNLIERYGADIRLPDLREEIAKRERRSPVPVRVNFPLVAWTFAIGSYRHIGGHCRRGNS